MNYDIIIISVIVGIVLGFWVGKQIGMSTMNRDWMANIKEVLVHGDNTWNLFGAIDTESLGMYDVEKVYVLDKAAYTYMFKCAIECDKEGKVCGELPSAILASQD